MELFAAIDVGSNSVRLQIAAFLSGFQHQVVHEDRAVTRLGESVFQTGKLSARAMEATLGVLKKFRETADEHGVVAIQAVGTSALRDAANSKSFLQAVKRECGLEVQVVSGREEARLIHLGVISRLPDPEVPVTILDIGGGSAEFIAGSGRRMAACLSMPLGAVRLTEMFMESDPPSREEIERLEGYLRKKLQRVRKVLQERTPAGNGTESRKVIGTSGTLSAITRAVTELDVRPSQVEGEKFSAARAEAFYQRIRRLPVEARREIPGIGTRRAEIIIAGAALVALAMRELEMPEIAYSDAGLRDGVLVQLAARNKGDAAGIQYLKAERLDTVRALAERFAYHESHSGQAARLARELFRLFQPLHKLADSYGEVLEAAALLHDVGGYINTSKYHKHSYYVIANSDMPGYTDAERMMIALLARYHRGAWPAPEHQGFRELPAAERDALTKLAVLLRLADACDNSRSRLVESVVATIKPDRVELTLLTSGPAELEQWTARKCAPAFRKYFGARFDVQVQTMKPAVL